METKNLTLANGKPSRVTVEMTIEEAAAIAKTFGGMSYTTFHQKFPGLGTEFSEIYGCLVGEVFNRFWDDGVDGFLRGDEE